MNLDKLKDTARRFELREEWRKAIDTYRTAADRLIMAGEAQDPSLYNRVGDLELKAGDQAAALAAYERAAHIYADQGFFNNAIALCGKILRVDPRRTNVYLHLAELHAEKNVLAEAVRNATEYFRRMQGENRVDEAVATLRKYAARFSGSTELRNAVSAILVEMSGEGQGIEEELEDQGGGPPSPDGSWTSESGESLGPGKTGSQSQELVFLDTGVGPVVDISAPTEPGAPPEVPPTLAELERMVPTLIEPTSIGTEIGGERPDSDLKGLEPTLLDAGLEAGEAKEEEMTLTFEAPEIELLEVEGLEPMIEGDGALDGEALFDGLEVEPATAGAASGRVLELEARLDAFEVESRWTEAYAAALELSQLEPGRVFRHQRKVELAYQTGQRDLLVASYLGLAEVLQELGATTNAAVVYQRVLEHDPQNAGALAALGSLERETPEEPDPVPESDFVDLGALILDTEPARDTRIRVEQGEPVGDEEQDFLTTLAQFKEGLAANVEASDFQTHYDLGIAFKEMGLLDEAIAQFQKALNSPGGHLRSAEALGMVFFEKGQFGVAEAVLSRAIETQADGEGENIGLLYWIGRAVEAQGRPENALKWYERAMAVDITFEDVSDRLARLAEGRES